MKRFEVRVGVFVIITLIIFVSFILSLGRERFIRRGLRFVVEFDYVEGLKPLSPVRLSGYDVGVVKDIGIAPQGRPVYVKVEVKDFLKIPRDSIFIINTLGLLGEKYLEIVPGEDENFIRQGEHLKGKSSLPLKTFGDYAHAILKKLDSFLENMDTLFKDREFQAHMRGFFENIDSAFREFDKALKVLNKEEGTLGKLLYDSSLYEKFDAFIEDIKRNPWKLLHRPRKRRRK